MFNAARKTTIENNVRYMGNVKAAAWRGRHRPHDDVFDLTEKMVVSRREWAWIAGLVIGAAYVGGCVVHTTLTLIQWALS